MCKCAPLHLTAQHSTARHGTTLCWGPPIPLPPQCAALSSTHHPEHVPNNARPPHPQEVSNQAGTTIAVLAGFEEAFRAQLLLETDVLRALVAHLGSSPPHSQFHGASALVTLGGTPGSRCQQEVREIWSIPVALCSV